MPETECSRALEEGDRLRAAGQREAARTKYLEARDQCVLLEAARMRLYELRHPTPRPAGTIVGGNVVVDVDLGEHEDVRLAWFAAYWDGALMREGALPKLTTGQHDVDVELYFQATGNTSSPAPVRLDVQQQVTVPETLVGQKWITDGSVRIRVTDSGGDRPLSARLAVTSEVEPAKPWEPTGEKVVMLAPNVGTEHVLSDRAKFPHRPLVPSAMKAVQRDHFWGLYKICVNREGVVTKVQTMKAAFELGPIEPQWRAAMRTWRFRPFLIDDVPVAFCYPARIAINNE